ncbi:MAG: peptidoglycan-binding protein [Hyphomonas sp.]
MARMIVDVPGTGPIDLNKVIRLLPQVQGWNFFRMTTQQRYILGIVQAWPRLLELGLDTPLRMGHFLGQGLVETGWLRYASEDLHYSAKGLIATFSVYKNNPALAAQHAKKPELIAETVYGGRARDLGNTEPGDGYKYRGRGFIQLTGRANYTQMADLTGMPLVDDPDYISRDLEKSVEAAAMYWKANNINRWADQNDAVKVSRAVNRGNADSAKLANHEAERIFWTNKALELTLAPGIAAPDAPLPDTPPPPPGTPSLKPLQVGNRGDRVRQLQSSLEALGYVTGGIDGIYGGGTRRAVVAFQHEEGLPVTGIADAVTLGAIETALQSGGGMSETIDSSDPRSFGPPA